MNPRTTTLTMLAFVLFLLPATASGLATTDTQQALDATWASSTVDIVRPVLCTPDDGNDYWIDYCVSWTTSHETVRYVKDARGDDPWCVVYPVPCAPSPADPIQWDTTTARLSYLQSSASPNADVVCDDLIDDDCPAPLPAVCARLMLPCDRIDLACTWICSVSSDDIALADIDSDLAIDGVAVHTQGTWTYVGLCDDHTLSFECFPSMTMQVIPPTQYAEQCTPSTDDYWVDHCTTYETVPVTAYTHRAAIAPDSDICIVYPVPCVPSYDAHVVVGSVSGTMYRYHHEGEVDEGEIVSDACQAHRLCDNIAITATMATIQADLDWRVVQNAGLLDIDGDGWAEGMAVGYVPAWAGTHALDEVIEIQTVVDGAMVTIPYEYVPFACVEVHPIDLSTRVDSTCSVAVTPITHQL